MDEYTRIGGNILKAIAHEPKEDNATAEGFFNWFAGPVKDVVQGIMGRKELKSLITPDQSGTPFAHAQWKRDIHNMPGQRIPLPPQNVTSYRATLNKLFYMTVPHSTDFDEDTKAKYKEMLDYNVGLIQDIPELIIMDVVHALEWLKGEFDARVVGLRSAARSGRHEGRQEVVSDAVVRSAVQQFVAQIGTQANDRSDTQTPQKSDKPDVDISTPTRSSLKPPTELEKKIAEYYDKGDKTQADVADYLSNNQPYRDMLAKRWPLTQGKVTRIIAKVNRFRIAHGLTPIETCGKGKAHRGVKAVSVDPEVIEMGERTHKGTGLRQTGNSKNRGEDN